MVGRILKKVICIVVLLMMCVDFSQVRMYEYFGVGPQVLEDVGDMYQRFLCWLPKYYLSTSPKHSLQAWRMVIDNLTTDDVSFFFFLLCGLASFHSMFFCDFQMYLKPWLRCEEHAECAWAQKLNDH